MSSNVVEKLIPFIGLELFFYRKSERLDLDITMQNIDEVFGFN
jgi:hypothetical protein